MLKNNTLCICIKSQAEYNHYILQTFTNTNKYKKTMAAEIFFHKYIKTLNL